MKQNKDIVEKLNLSDLTNKLKSEDEKYASLCKRIQVIYWVLIPIYFLLTIRHIVDNSPLTDVIGSICFMGAMLIFALFFKNYYKEYKYVDYSQPTLLMLKKAANRYKPFQTKGLWVLLAILLIDAGLSFTSYPRINFIWVQVSFLGATSVALLIGLLIWRVRYKPLRDAALHLVRELED